MSAQSKHPSARRDVKDKSAQSPPLAADSTNHYVSDADSVVELPSRRWLALASATKTPRRLQA